MQTILQFLTDAFGYVLTTLVHNFPSLALGIFTAAIITVFVDPNKVKAWLMRKSAVSIPASVAVGAFTPFCACGTMAVILSMMATSLPWGPIMAFLTSSPLMSPDAFIMISGILGLSFAIALTVASVILGLGSGGITYLIEKKTKFLDNQARINSVKTERAASCGCDGVETDPGSTMTEDACCIEAGQTASCGCTVALQAPLLAAAGACCGSTSTRIPGLSAGGKLQAPAFLKKWRVAEIGRAAYEVGVKKILLYFTLFAALGYIINRFVPASIITGLFGGKNLFSVPLAALVGLPLYVTGSSSIPIIQSLMQNGASASAMLAFMITGPGTSAGVIAGIATIMKKNAILLYVGYILVGAILMGYAYDLILGLIG